MRTKLHILGFISVLCVNLSAAELENGSLAIDAASGKIAKPFTVKEIDGVKYVIGSERGGVEFEIDVLKDGKYIIWGKAYGTNGKHNSFFVIVDNMPYMIWDVKVSKEKKTRWMKIKGRKNFKNGRINFKKGKHKISITGREDGTVLEKIFIGKTKMKPPQ